MGNISDFSELNKIDETRSSIIYKGQKKDDDKTYIIKELKSSDPSLSEIARFRQEYNIIKKIDIDGIIKTYDILEYNNKIALVLEYFNGVSLKKYIEDKDIELKQFLQIAIKISKTLGHLHKENIIHKDIKPSNILYNFSTKDLKIVDFGISNEITHENNEVYNSQVLEGTLLYISPEQTGRMNRQLDYRTDMYSLGITFYELLTGDVPFYSKDPMEIIHSHIAIDAKPPEQLNPSIPDILSKIILKLISKMPENRYQNCFGVMNDLEECFNKLQTTDKIESFEIGQNDISPFFTIPQLLMGRDKEVDLLLNSIEELCTSETSSEVIVVSGHPGIGKSAVINEIQKSILSKRGYFISGKYDQFRRDVPYSAIIQAFKSLVNQILRQSDRMIDDWKSKLLNILGPNGKVITDVIPDIELIIGKQPDIPELGPEQNQNRFNYVFKNFISILTVEDHPLVLFLDDLQWIDSASLNLLELIITDEEIKFFLLIGSFRDNEVDETHPLMMTFNELEKNGLTIKSIHLDVLPEESVNEMISRFLDCEKNKSEELAKMVHGKTNGNPFFVNQFMKTLYDEKLLVLDPKSGWIWDMTKIDLMQITDNVVDLIAEKITRLPVETLEVMKICSCIGNRFELDMISVIYDKSIDETLDVISVALSEGMIIIQDDLYRFPHDRIQEAAYSLVPAEEKEKLHYKIGNLMIENTKKEDFHKRILYIVDQLNEGKNLIKSEDERIYIASLNFQAGNKAKSSTAYKSAMTYYKIGIDLLNYLNNENEISWEKNYELTLSLYSSITEAAYLNSDHSEMNLFAETVLQKSHSLLDSIKVYEIKIHAFMAQNKLQEALRVGLDALKFFKIKFPKNPGKGSILIALLKTIRLLRGKKNNDLLELPIMNDHLMEAAVRLLAALTSIAYWTKPNLLPLIIFKLIEMTLKYGNSSLSPYSYCTYGFILCTLLKIDTGYNFGKLGLDLIEKMRNKNQIPRTHFVMNAFVRHWKEPLRNTVDPLLIGFQRGLEVGDLEFAGHSIMLNLIWKFYSGYEANALKEEMKKFGSLLKNIKQETQLQMITLNEQFLENITVGNEEPYNLKGSIYDSDEMLKVHIDANDLSAIATVYYYSSILNYLFDKYELALKNLKKTKKYLEALVGLYHYSLYPVYDSLTRLALYDTYSWFKKKFTIRKIKNNIKQIKKWLKLNPENQLNKYHLVLAEYMNTINNKLEAIRNYNLSIKYARQNDFVQEEAIANECAAKFWLKNEEIFYASNHMQAAYNAYTRWGATAKTKQLKEKYSDLLTIINEKAADNIKNDKDLVSTDSESAGSSTRSTTEFLDLSTVMKSTQAISSEIVLEQLLEKMMKIVLENAGAQRGFLILESDTDKKLYIEAEGTVNQEIKVLQSIPVVNTNKVSIEIINYSFKIKKNIVLHNAAIEGDFINDPYIIENNIKSVLCMPIIQKGKISGLLYLENNLITNTFTPERLELLQVIASQAAISIVNARLMMHRENSAKFEKEMEIAAQIQTGLVPKNPQIKGYELSAFMTPADDVGGDYYDVINIADLNWLIVGDVSGHGVPAGLVMMMVQTCIHNTLSINPNFSPSELLTIVNKTITKNIQLMGENKYMTITVLVTQNDGKFIYSGLHRDIMIYRKKTETLEIIETHGLWIGLMNNIDDALMNDTIQLDKGDTMLIYTDGIVEAWKKGTIEGDREVDTDMFGTDKLENIFSASASGKPDEVRDSILIELENYDLNDDVTMVVIKRI